MMDLCRKIIFNMTNRIKLKHKLLISYFVLILTPLCIFTVISYRNISKSIEAQTVYSASQILEQSTSYLDYKVSNIIYASDQIFLDENLVRILKRDENAASSPELLKDYNEARKSIFKVFKVNDMIRLTLYINDNIYYSHELTYNNPFSFSSIKDMEEEFWYKRLKEFRGKAMWIPPHNSVDTGPESEKVVSALRIILYSVSSNYSEPIAYLKIDLAKSEMDRILKKANTTKNGVAYIQNSEGDIISSSNDKLSSRFSIDKVLASHVAHNDSQWRPVTIKGEEYLVSSNKIKETDWQIISIMPYKEILTAGNQTKNGMILLMLLIAVLSYIIAYLFSNSITKRINTLIKRMKRVQNGDLSAIVTVHGKDEMSELAENYNYMIDKLNDYTKLQYESGQAVKSAELKALQAQINPHFLYNTLELIHWTALRKRVPEISNIVQALAKFYKLSLSKGKDIISIKDEIAHIETYVQLQNYRYNNRILLQLDIDNEIYKYSILKLLLQPVVENAIIHGILKKKGRSGIIKLSGKMETDTIQFTISDDGIGMTVHQIAELLEGAMPNDHQGYGIKNVNNRIKLYYGNQYGLMYKSSVGEGTIVVLRIPAISEN